MSSSINRRKTLNKPGLLPSITGIRGICATIICVAHFYVFGYFDQIKQHNDLKRAGLMFFFNGALAVNIFFIISGFLITHLLLKEKEREAGVINLSAFYKRRILRIFPAYYFLLLVYTILQIIKILYINPSNWVACAFFAKQFITTGPFEIEHLWTISVEEIFYLFWPLLLISSGKSITKISCFLILLVTLYRLFSYQYPADRSDFSIFARGDALLIGCLLAMHYNKACEWVKKTKRFHWIFFIFLVLSIAIKDFFFHQQWLNPAQQNRMAPIDIMMRISYSLFGNEGLFTNIFIGFFLVRAIVVKDWFFKLLNTSTLVFVGKISYSIYLWQQIFTINNSYFAKYNVWQLSIGILVASLFSHYCIERPFLKLKNQIVFE